MTRQTYLRLIGAMIVVAIVSSVFLLQFQWFGDAASTQRGPIDTLFDVMIVLSCVVFSIVIVMFGYAIWKFRVKPGDEGDGKPIHGNTKLEIAWTVIPTVIVLFGAGYSWIVLDDIEAKSADSMRLDVTAQQFEWSFGYPEKMIGTGASATEVTTHELHVPVDRQLDVHLTALDVLHSFWVPEWGIKRDAVPARDPEAEGVDNTFVVTPDQDRDVQPDLHRALRHRALDDARHRGGRVAGGLRSVAERAGRLTVAGPAGGSSAAGGSGTSAG